MGCSSSTEKEKIPSVISTKNTRTPGTECSIPFHHPHCQCGKEVGVHGDEEWRKTTDENENDGCACCQDTR